MNHDLLLDVCVVSIWDHWEHSYTCGLVSICEHFYEWEQYNCKAAECTYVSIGRSYQWPKVVVTVHSQIPNLVKCSFQLPHILSIQFSSVQSLSCVRLFATPWIAARQASLSITNSQSSPKFMCIESVMPSSRLILCRPLLLLPPIPPSIRVFSKESTLRMRWPKYWSFSLSISPSNEHQGLIFFRMD